MEEFSKLFEFLGGGSRLEDAAIQNKAATRIQSVQRGRTGRRDFVQRSAAMQKRKAELQLQIKQEEIQVQAQAAAAIAATSEQVQVHVQAEAASDDSDDELPPPLPLTSPLMRSTVRSAGPRAATPPRARRAPAGRVYTVFMDRSDSDGGFGLGLSQKKQHGGTTRAGWMGAKASAVVVVDKVIPGSPAAIARVRVGDSLLAVCGCVVDGRGSAGLRSALTHLAAEEKAILEKGLPREPVEWVFRSCVVDPAVARTDSAVTFSPTVSSVLTYELSPTESAAKQEHWHQVHASSMANAEESWQEEEQEEKEEWELALEQKERLKEQSASAVKIQAVARGRQGRLQLQQQWEAEEAEARRQIAQLKVNATEREAAAAKIQSLHRGRQVRQQRHEQHEAATRIQATHRGRCGRQEAAEKHEKVMLQRRVNALEEELAMLKANIPDSMPQEAKAKAAVAAAEHARTWSKESPARTWSDGVTFAVDRGSALAEADEVTAAATRIQAAQRGRVGRVALHRDWEAEVASVQRELAQLREVKAEQRQIRKHVRTASKNASPVPSPERDQSRGGDGVNASAAPADSDALGDGDGGGVSLSLSPAVSRSAAAAPATSSVPSTELPASSRVPSPKTPPPKALQQAARAKRAQQEASVALSANKAEDEITSALALERHTERQRLIEAQQAATPLRPAKFLATTPPGRPKPATTPIIPAATPTRPPTTPMGSTGKQGDRVIVLMTSSGDQRAVRLVVNTLTTKYAGVAVEQIDGSAAENKALRDSLWAISGQRAVYPQVFVALGAASEPVFVSAGAEEFENLAESNLIETAVLEATPDIRTLDKALAPLLDSPDSARAVKSSMATSVTAAAAAAAEAAQLEVQQPKTPPRPKAHATTATRTRVVSVAPKERIRRPDEKLSRSESSKRQAETAEESFQAETKRQRELAATKIQCRHRGNSDR